MVTGGQQVRVMLDNDDGVAGVDQAMKDVDQAGNVFEVLANGGLVEQVEGGG